ncbi:MAG: NusG domain II-containing protein [Calditrichia bacterium]
MSGFQFFRPGDLALVLLLIAAPLYAIFQLNGAPGNDRQVIVEIAGQQQYVFPLQNNKTIPLDSFTRPVILQIENGSVRISENFCPKKICIQTGAIENPGQMIACVPLKLLIYIQAESGAEKSRQIEAITG